MNYEHDKTIEVLSTMKQAGYDLGKRVAEMTTPPNQLSQAQMLALDEMVERRIANTDETRREAIEHIINYLKQNDNNNN